VSSCHRAAVDRRTSSPAGADAAAAGMVDNDVKVSQRAPVRRRQRASRDNTVSTGHVTANSEFRNQQASLGLTSKVSSYSKSYTIHIHNTSIF